MARPRLSEIEKKIKKMEAERLRRQKIKNDPILYERWRKKEHMRYLQRIKDGKLKLVKDLTSREHRVRKKLVKERVRKFRLKKEMAKGTQIRTPQSTAPHDEWHPQPGPSRKTSSQKRVKREKAKVYRMMEKMRLENKKLIRQRDKFKKRYQRLERKTYCEHSTPKSKVSALLSKSSPRSKNLVRRKLIFAEVITEQLKNRYKTLPLASQQIFVKGVGGDILRKYKCLNQSRTFFSYKTYKANRRRNIMVLKFEKKIKKTAKDMEIKVKSFLEDDENSTQCPRKRDFVRIKSTNIQKRYLSDTLKNLHAKFCNSIAKISYAAFCSFRPKNIVQPKVSSRNTCLCLKHENMKLLVESLHVSKILPSNNPKEIITQLCCSNRSEQGMLRTCPDCSEKKFSFTELNTEQNFEYKQWVTIQEPRIIRGKQQNVKRLVKQEITTTLGDLLEKFKRDIHLFMTHTFYIEYQNRAFKILRNCSDTVLTLQIDFSENYCCKYGKEPQSVHFGASRQQLSLHTGVAYSGTRKFPFCSVSDNLRHDARSVAAHLEPVLRYLLGLCHDVDTLNFISDGPTTQYRNRTIFTYIGKLLPVTFPRIKKITWNYCEAGHGKGPADGVGGALKRSADNIVARNHDVNDLKTFMNAISGGNTSIKIELIDEESFSRMDSTFDELELITPVKNTLKIHQVKWDRVSNTLHFNALTCIDCAVGLECTKWKIANSIRLSESEVLIENLPLEEQSQSNAAAAKESSPPALAECEPTAEQEEQQSSFSDQLTPLAHLVLSDDADQGEWVAVIYDEEWFPGVVEKKQDDEVTVNSMARSGINNFYWPDIADRQTLKTQGILYKMNEPPLPVSRRFMAVKNYNYIEFLKNNLIK